MKIPFRSVSLKGTILAAVLMALGLQAFPPAPHHLLYGSVRDEMGEPLVNEGSEIFLETATGIVLPGVIAPGTEPGVNYEIRVPMDSGVTADAYKPTALSPTVPFRIKVKIGSTVYLPLQMRANYANLGKPALSTRLDLTLGEDLDGDGLPDAWERALLALSGAGGTIESLKPGDDFDGDGLSNLQEYIAGTYAFDPQDGFRLQIISGTNAVPRLKFLAITSRSYSLLASTNLQTWTPMTFKLSGSAGSAPVQSYSAQDVRPVEIEPQLPAGIPASKFFFKAQVQ
jgi:hypothetical protein